MCWQDDKKKKAKKTIGRPRVDDDKKRVRKTVSLHRNVAKFFDNHPSSAGQLIDIMVSDKFCIDIKD